MIRDFKRATIGRGMILIAIGAAGMVGVGCDSVIPRRDLRLLAKTLPPSQPVTVEERDAIARRIREHSGVQLFEFSDSEFTPETRLPPGTEWIMAVFLGD